MKKVVLLNVHDIPEVGSTIEPFSKVWWQIGFKSKLISVVARPDGGVLLSLEYVGFPVDGDKFTTFHGQKGVATILPDNEMPVVNRRTAEIIIGSSALIKRGTASQVIEAACGQFASLANLTHCSSTPSQVLENYRWEYRLGRNRNIIDDMCSRYQSDVMIRGPDGELSAIPRKVRSSSIHEIRNVKANYGVIRVMQSIFMASDKMSCTQKKTMKHSMNPCSKSSLGGSKRLGEMELAQLEASGFKHCLQEFKDRSDSCVIEVCSKSKCIKMLCAC